MIITDEEALICDFAETYGIYDYKRLPLTTAAIFASGLRENSRIKMKMSGVNVSFDTVLSAAIADRIGLIAWMNSKDGARGANRPDSILDKLINPNNPRSNVLSFDSAEEFEEEKRRILGK